MSDAGIIVLTVVAALVAATGAVLALLGMYLLGALVGVGGVVALQVLLWTLRRSMRRQGEQALRNARRYRETP